MFTALALTVLAMLPPAGVVSDRVDLIEVNHVYDDLGNPVFRQAIFYDWRLAAGAFEVRAWRLLKHADQRPVRDWDTGRWTMIFQDGDVLREVRAAFFYESWTQYDVEIDQRRRLPPEYRRGLLFERRPRMGSQ